MSISTLAISRRLEAKDFTESQAEGVAEELVDIVKNSDLVTKDFLRVEMGELRGELKADMASLETKLMVKIGDLKSHIYFYTLLAIYARAY